MRIGGLKLSDTIKEKAEAILAGVLMENNGPFTYAESLKECSIALALLTSPVKAEREAAKTLVREWRVSTDQNIREKIKCN